jgi:hypothetical protein
MADPVTLAMVGAAAGAVTNKKDPLKGALMGAALGGGGGLLAGGAAAGGAAAGGSGLLGGAAPLGATAAGGLTASAIPAGGVVGGGALLAGGAPAAAAPGLMSQLANPAVLAAGSQLAGSMTPRPAQSYPLPMRRATAVENVIDQVPIVRGPSGPMPRLQDDELIRTLLWPRELAYPVSMGGKP